MFGAVAPIIGNVRGDVWNLKESQMTMLGGVFQRHVKVVLIVCPLSSAFG